jgi:hypothetical protein
VQAIVTRFFVPTTADLKEWQAQPEDYWVDRSPHAMGRHSHPRPEAEGLFCMLCIMSADFLFSRIC